MRNVREEIILLPISLHSDWDNFRCQGTCGYRLVSFLLSFLITLYVTDCIARVQLYYIAPCGRCTTLFCNWARDVLFYCIISGFVMKLLLLLHYVTTNP